MHHPMSTLVNDLKIAVRSLAKNPGFTAVVVVALALGVAVNVGVFGIVNELLFRPLAVNHPEELALVFTHPQSAPRDWALLSHPEYQRVREERQVFSGVLATAIDAWVFDPGQAAGGRSKETPRGSWGEYLGSDAFTILGLRPVLGRAFTPDEDRPGGAPVIMLSYRSWRTRFHADPAVLGRKVYLNTGALTVVGVMPPDFAGLQPLLFSKEGLEYWLPLGQRGTLSDLTPDWMNDRNRRQLKVLGRLRPGVTVAQAQARADLLATTLAREFPVSNADLRLHIAPEIEGRYGAYHDIAALASALAVAVAGLVLVICCANVANLLLARIARRGRELAIRVALGASRARLARLLLTESLLLAALGGGLGLGLAFWFGDALAVFLPPLPDGATLNVDSDSRVVAWGLAATVLAGLGFGILPAWRASRGSLTSALKTDLRSEGYRLRRPGLRQALVIAQLAISVVVIVAGGLFLRTLKKMEGIDPGYRQDRLVSSVVDPGLFTDDSGGMRTFFDQLTRRLEQVPGVASVSATLYMPLVNAQGACGPIIKEGDPAPRPNQSQAAVYSVVSPHYFSTMGTPLLRGRDFTAGEYGEKPDTVVVNRTLARQLFGKEENALGRRFRIGGLESTPLRIIGVTADGHYQSLLEDPRTALYLPGFLPELHDRSTMKSVIVRGAEGASLTALAEALQREVHRLDPRLPLDDIRIGDAHLLRAMIQIQMAVGLGLILGVLALGLASMGIYSVMTYTVGQRTREIGIRIALGGQTGDVLRMVVGQGLGLVAIGVAAGSVAAWLVSRLLASLLYGVTAGDPLTYLATGVLIVLVALLATLVPARRAALVDPMIALRAD
jgi:putative ABC transport system permease protein